MEVSVTVLRWSIGAMGLAVVASYVIGFSRADDPEALWGGISGGLRTAMVPFMLLAAAGFLFVAYQWFWRWDEATLAALHYPWGEADGQGTGRVLWAYLFYLVPSMLWLESTLLHIHVGAAWTQALVIVVLSLVTVGLVMLGLLAYGAVQDGVEGAPWILAAVVAMAIQSTVNDNILWVWKFPW